MRGWLLIGSVGRMKGNLPLIVAVLIAPLLALGGYVAYDYSHKSSVAEYNRLRERYVHLRLLRAAASKPFDDGTLPKAGPSAEELGTAETAFMQKAEELGLPGKASVDTEMGLPNR